MRSPSSFTPSTIPSFRAYCLSAFALGVIVFQAPNLDAQGTPKAVTSTTGVVSFKPDAASVKDVADQALVRAIGGIPGSKGLIRTQIRPFLDKIVVTVEQENEVGKAMAAHWKSQLGQKLDSNAKDLAYLREVGKELAKNAGHRPGIVYTFHLVEANIENAFAHAGGHVYFFRGLFDKFSHEAELASVVGHEISHIELQHCVEFVKPVVALKALKEKFPFLAGLKAEHLVQRMAEHTVLGFTQEALEVEADGRGLELVCKADYDPRQSSQIISKLAPLKPIPKTTQGLSREVLEALHRSHPESRLRRDKAEIRAKALVEAHGNGPLYRGDRNLAERISIRDKKFKEG